MKEERYPIKITMSVEICEFFNLTDEELTAITKEHVFPKEVKKKMLETLERMAKNNTFSDDAVYVKVHDETENYYISQEYGRIFTKDEVEK